MDSWFNDNWAIRQKVSENISSLVAVVTGCQRILAALQQMLQDVRGYWQPCSSRYRVSEDISNLAADVTGCQRILAAL